MNIERDERVGKNYIKIVNKVASQAGNTEWLFKLCGVISSFALPTLIGLVAAFWVHIFASFKIFVVVLLVLITLQLVLGTINTLNLFNVSQFHSAVYEIKKAYDEIKFEYRSEAEAGEILGETVEYTEVFLGALPIYQSLIREDHKNFTESVSELMDYFIENRQELFGIARGDLWNFAVFVFCKKEGLLLPVWRKCAPSLWDEESPSSIRAFGPCDGHVGAAFRRGEAIITDNAQDSTIRAFTEPPVYLCRETDENIYTSFASFPLESGNSLPNGVLVATNNQIGTYNPKNCLALRSAGHFISRLTEEVPDEKWRKLALPWTPKV